MRNSQIRSTWLACVATALLISCGNDEKEAAPPPINCAVSADGLTTVAGTASPSQIEACGGDPAAQLEYCGGTDQGNIQSQLSCTAFPAKPEGYASHGGCQSNEVYELAGSSGQAGVWRSNGASDYWVIHGCDGSGLMLDGWGANFYIEHFVGSAAAPTTPTDCSQLNPNDCQGPGWNQDACGCVHERTAFVHPGTSRAYDYDAGMWTFAPYDWPDQKATGSNKKMWWANMGLPDVQQLQGNYKDYAATAFVVMYPWVCNGPWDGLDMSAYWGSNANYANGLPFGSITAQTKCYYDNEPWDGIIPGRHNTSTLIPPAWEAYKFVKAKSSDTFITGWKIGYKYLEDPSPTYISDATSFRLEWVPGGAPY
jgi:hypothetical protein